MRIKSQYLQTTAQELAKQKQQARSTAVSETGIMGLGLITTGSGEQDSNDSKK